MAKKQKEQEDQYWADEKNNKKLIKKANKTQKVQESLNAQLEKKRLLEEDEKELKAPKAPKVMTAYERNKKTIDIN